MKSLFSILIACFIALGCYAQGLQFRGNDMLIEERTSYSVFGNTVPSFKDRLSIEFHISILQFNSFGYIFRLKDDHTQQTYNLTYTYKDDKNSSFKFNTEGKDNLVSIDMQNDRMTGSSKWLHISLSFLLKEKSLILSINGERHKIENPDLPDKLHPRIYFGKNEHVVDLPVYAIRDLIIKGDAKEYKFQFKESVGEQVHDDKGKIVGHVSNPVWLINNAYYWRLKYVYESQIVSGVNYSDSKQAFLFFNADSLTLLDLKTGLSSVKRQRNRLPVDMQLGTTFMDEVNNRLFVYEVNNLPIGNTTIAFLDGADWQEWIPLSTKYLPVQLHHHDGFFDKKKNRYIVFGGFGNQQYNKEFLSYTIEGNKWDTLSFSGDRIIPRYFSGMAGWEEKNQLFIFGGMGNESGDHTIGRGYLYDLYKVNLDDMRVEKLWDISWERENVVPARDMIMLNDSLFYVLCYPEHKPSSYLQLYQFSIGDGHFKILGDSIPIVSEKIATTANLYYSGQLKEFYCTVQEFQDDGSSVIRLYSLSSPAINQADLIAYGNFGNDITRWQYLLSVIVVLFFAYILYRRYKKERKAMSENSVAELAVNDERPKDKANAIYLFGNFTVIDKKGKDITYMFSTKLKQALLLILQYSINDGIPTQLFSETLWPDKSEYNTKNLRNVTLNHLRKVLTELQGIELLSDKGNLKLVMADTVYCDYSCFVESILLDNREGRIEGILKVLPRGKFLKLVNDVFFNEFIEKTENHIRLLLPMDIEKVYDRQAYNLALQLSEILFITDPLNEKALYYQVNSLSKLRLTDEAKRNYMLFVVEYKKERKSDYPHSLSFLLKDSMQARGTLF